MYATNVLLIPDTNSFFIKYSDLLSFSYDMQCTEHPLQSSTLDKMPRLTKIKKNPFEMLPNSNSIPEKNPFSFFFFQISFADLHFNWSEPTKIGEKTFQRNVSDNSVIIKCVFNELLTSITVSMPHCFQTQYSIFIIIHVQASIVLCSRVKS